MRERLRILRLTGTALAVGAVVLAPAASGDPSQTLHARESALADKSRAAVLSLYAIDSELATARTQLATIQQGAGALQHERSLVAQRVRVAVRGVKISQAQLAFRLRAIYERGDIDPIAIILGADSLEAALTGLDNLGQMARGDRSVVEQVRGARTSLTGLRVRLADRQRTLDRMVVAAETTATSLEATRAARAAYLARLSSERRMTSAAIARTEEQAEAARFKAQTLQLAAAVPAPVEPVAAEAVAAAPAGARTMTVSVTGYALPGTTATGIPVGWGVAAVDPSVIPLGTRFSVPGYGEAVAADTGGAVQGATIDLWFPTVARALAWGRRTVTITLP